MLIVNITDYPVSQNTVKKQIKWQVYELEYIQYATVGATESWEFAIKPCPKCVVHCCNGFMSNLDQLQSTFSRVALIPWVEPSIFVFPCNFMANKLDLLCKCAQTISATIFLFHQLLLTGCNIVDTWFLFSLWSITILPKTPRRFPVFKLWLQKHS